MRWIRLLSTLMVSTFKKKLKVTDTVVNSFRVWITDIDVSIMNHAAVMTVFETGRLELMVRSNFFKVASKNKWYFPTQAISVQFYRPLKVFQKAKLQTRVSFVDEKWIYVEQKIEREGKTVASCIVKSTVKKDRDVVSNSEIIKALKIDNLPSIKYDLIETYELENIQMEEKLANNWNK